jgi:glycosyltransferase involved in cell wall biosynthesis
MKILQVTNFFKPSWEAGGPPRVAYEISKKLAEKGHEVTVYTTDGFKSRLDVEKNKLVNVDGIRTYYFRNLSSYLTRKMVLPIPYFLPFVAQKEVNNFDIIHIHEYRTFLAVVIHYYANKNNIPYVLQAHGSVLPFFQKQNLKYIFDIVFGYRILKDASKVIALTNTEAEQYKKMGVNEDKIEIVPNGIDLSEYEKLPMKGEFRRKYSIKDNDKIILYLGRIHKSKGIDLLIDSFATIADKYDNIKLVLIGPDDNYQAEFRQQVNDLKINDKVFFAGFLDYCDKIAAFVDSEVFVTPMFSGFPLTFLEACACGIPIITTTKGDKLEWIDNNVGYVVEYDKSQIAEAIIKILTNEVLRKRFGENGKMTIQKLLNLEKTVNSIEKIYYEVIYK